MTGTKTPNVIRLNIDDLKALIKRSANTIDAAKGDRKEANADIALAMETVSNAGIPRKAMALAMAYAELDEDARAGFDVAYRIAREALGVPMDDQLFDRDGMPNVRFAAPEAEETEAAPKKRGRPPKDKTADQAAKNEALAGALLQ